MAHNPARPSSPWTPSYSVVVQGSPLHASPELTTLDSAPPVEVSDPSELNEAAATDISSAQASADVAPPSIGSLEPPELEETAATADISNIRADGDNVGFMCSYHFRSF